MNCSEIWAFCIGTYVIYGNPTKNSTFYVHLLQFMIYPRCNLSGVINETKYGGTIGERVYCIKHVMLVGVLLSNCLADWCLLNI